MLASKKTFPCNKTQLQAVIYLLTPKYMNRPILCCLFLLLNSVSFSQEVFFFAGKVQDELTGELLEEASLEVNGKAHALDVFAEFRIYVETGDTIIFSHLGYQPYRLFVADTMSSASLPKTISLHRGNITLDEVEINNYELTDEMRRNAERNVQIMLQQAQDKSDNVYDKEPRFTPPPPQGTGMSSSQMFGFNTVALVQKIKRKGKKAPLLPAKEVISYEEYNSAHKQKDASDSIQNR